MSVDTPPTAPRPPKPPNPRARVRNRIFLWSLIPVLLVALFVTKVTLMYGAQAAGEDAYDSEGFGKAADEFDRNGTLNLFESWLTPFNRGDALYRDEDYSGAVDAFETALDDAPGDEECTVRINLSLAHEAIGDAALEEEKAEDAVTSWKAGREVLADGNCPDDAPKGEEQTETADEVDQRLEDKIEQNKPQDKKKQKQKKQQKQQQKKQKKQQKKVKKLKKRNLKGLKERRKWQRYDERDYGGDPGYHW